MKGSSSSHPRNGKSGVLLWKDDRDGENWLDEDKSRVKGEAREPNEIDTPPNTLQLLPLTLS